MKTYSLEQLKAKFKELGYEWLPFMFIGIRSKADEANKFDDTFVFVKNDILRFFPNTTNPGAVYLQKLLNPKGAAVLVPGQYKNAWGLGLHRGKYTALVQVRPVSVYRDADKDLKSENNGVIDTGLFGINIHKANTGISLLINGHSAGCQVFQNSADFDTIIAECKMCGQKQFTYTLLLEF
jgi:hypothetical protein